MVCPGPPGIRYDGHEFMLDLVRGLAPRQPQAVRDPEDMGVHGDGRLYAQFIQDDAGGLAPNPWQGLKGLAVEGHFAAIALHQDPGGGDQVLRLGPEQADGRDERNDPFLAEFQHSAGRIRNGEEFRRRLVHGDVGGLRRKGHRRQEGVGARIVQLRPGVALGRLEALEQGRNTGALGGRRPPPGALAIRGFRHA